MSFLQWLINLIGPLFRCSNSKTSRWISSHIRQRRHFDEIATKEGKNVWLHVSSMGEYAVIKPIADRFEQEGYNVITSWFSVTGPGPYLPVDSRRNAKAWIEAINPVAAIFSVSEYWPNFLSELENHSIPTYLVGAKIKGTEPFFKWYGAPWRRGLRAFKTIYTVDDESVELLNKVHRHATVKESNPLFENASAKASEEWNDEILETFTNGRRSRDVFVAGSIHNDKDLEITFSLIKSFPNTKFIVVPHEPSEAMTREIRSGLSEIVDTYSELKEGRKPTARILVVDTVGSLAYIYRYGSYAYVGGGFTRLLHSLLEPVAYGLPLIFGPRTERKITPQQIIAKGLGKSVNTEQDAVEWLKDVRAGYPEEKRAEAINYIAEGQGAADRIYHNILSDISSFEFNLNNNLPKGKPSLCTRIVIGLLRGLAHLPMRALYGIADFIYFILAHVIHYRQKVIDENILHSFPEKSVGEREKIKRGFYHYLADSIVEMAKLLHFSLADEDKHITIENAQIVNDMVSRGKNVVVFLAHYGNWEWVPSISDHFTPALRAFYGYKPLRDKLGEYLFHSMRKRWNSTGIPQKSLARQMLRMSKDGLNPFIVGFIADQRSNSDKTHHKITFMGQETPVNLVAEAIGQRSGCDFVYLDVFRPERGKYIFRFIEMHPNPADIEMPYVKEYFRMLEHTIRRNPSLWLWSHRRWLFH